MKGMPLTPDLHIQFEWDFEKEKVNIFHHKLSFTDACHVFSDVFQLNLFDEGHSDNEDRWIVIGEIPVMKIIVVVHTIRQGQTGDDSSVRIISARKATKKEREAYFARRPKK
jgi:uncharacterized DUF497 family protein